MDFSNAPKKTIPSLWNWLKSDPVRLSFFITAIITTVIAMVYLIYHVCVLFNWFQSYFLERLILTILTLSLCFSWPRGSCESNISVTTIHYFYEMVKPVHVSPSDVQNQVVRRSCVSNRHPRVATVQQTVGYLAKELKTSPPIPLVNTRSLYHLISLGLQENKMYPVPSAILFSTCSFQRTTPVSLSLIHTQAYPQCLYLCQWDCHLNRNQQHTTLKEERHRSPFSTRGFSYPPH